MTDKALILAYQSGDNSAMGRLYSRYKDELSWFIYGFVNDEEVARDLLQETFLQIMQGNGTYKPIAKVRTWLYTIARYRVYDKYERENAVKRKGIEVSKDDEDVLIRLTDRNNTPDKATDVKMEYQRVRKKATEINQDYAQAVLLHDYQGYKYHEIADMMNVEMGTVKSRIYRGRKLLQ